MLDRRCGTAGADPTPIGHPVSGTRVAIFTPRYGRCRRLCGELYAGGAGLARATGDKPAATAERFVADPHAATPGARMYRTGDLPAGEPDGTIDFLGRRPAGEESRGYRVEPGEVEAAIRESPGLRSALSWSVNPTRWATPDWSRSPPLRTSSESRRTGRPTALRLRCARTAAALVPARLTSCTGCRLTATARSIGPVRELPHGHREGDHTPMWPRGTMESFLAELWAAMLEIETVGDHDDFFRGRRRFARRG